MSELATSSLKPSVGVTAPEATGSMPHTPRVGIGIPVYNGERYVKEAIESILTQTFTDFELIISDNASTDRTEGICRLYASKDPRIRYYRNNENMGGSKNFTRVFELSRAPYFKWAAHDDLCAPTFLEKSVEVLDSKPAVGVCYPRSGFIDESGSVIGDHEAGCNLRSPRASERVRQFLAEAHTQCLPMFGLIRRDVLKRTSLVAPYISSDQILLLQLALFSEFYELPERLFWFREHSERSVWQFKTFAGHAGWYDPKRGSRIQLPRWRLVVEFFRSIAGADIPRLEARDCYISVIKWAWWHRVSLRRDLVMTVRQFIAMTFGLPPIQDKHSLVAVKGVQSYRHDAVSDPASTAGKASEGDRKV